MPVKFEWDLDPGSDGDMQSFQLDYGLNGSENDAEAEFYDASCPGVTPTTLLPNDDIWKKFDLTDDFDFDEMLEDVATVTWMNPAYTQTVSKNVREIMNHDCMWAGHCVSEKHERNNQKNQKCTNFMSMMKTPIKEESTTQQEPQRSPQQQSPQPPKVIVTTHDGSKLCVKKNAIVAPTHARSILLPPRIVQTNAKTIGCKNSNVSFRYKANDNGGAESPRPETPQSLSDSEDLDLDYQDMKVVEELAIDQFGLNFVNDIVNNASDDMNSASDVSNSNDEDYDKYMADTDDDMADCKHISIPPSKVTGIRLTNRTTHVKQEVPIARHYTANSFFSDHCYHLSKNARMDHLGVQTPSDSEEEIDVETVYGDSKKPNSRSSSSGGVLPTNPSFSDRQQLQLTVASAICKKEVKKEGSRASTFPNGYDLDDRTLKSKTPSKNSTKKSVRNSEVRRTGSNKRSAQFDDHNDYVTKSVKRKKHQYQRHFKNGKAKKSKARRSQLRQVGGGSSDSEPDSTEKRSIHNSMERQRRIDLRNAFEELRKLVPHTAGNEKAAKVVILSYGAEFCRSLTQEDSELTRRRAELRRQQEMLRARVSQLRRMLAARR